MDEIEKNRKKNVGERDVEGGRGQHDDDVLPRAQRRPEG